MSPLVNEMIELDVVREVRTLQNTTVRYGKRGTISGVGESVASWHAA